MNQYYDNYEPNSDYTKIVAIPGRAEQSREFNEIQSMQKEFLRRLSDVSLKEGSIISGCELTITNNVAYITSGKIYLQGLIRNIDASSVKINGVGDETICVRLEALMVTESEDITLLDPAQESENYGMPGAHRLKETLKLTANDNDATTIYKLHDGALLTIEAKPNIEVINDVLAVRTYDEMGNYKVSGLEVMKTNTYTDTQICVTVSEGKAYVKGYQINKPSSTNLFVDKSLDYTTVIAEPKIYNSSTLKYRLNNFPAKAINRVLVTIEVTRDITRGTTSSDILPNTPVVDIIKVQQGTTVYARGVDYQLINDSVNWLTNASNKPAIGSTYKVTWTYNKVLTEGVDYALTSEDSNYYLDFSGKTGLKPIQNSEMKIDYDFYLNRKDIVVLNKDGEVLIIKGQANLSDYVATPSYNNVEYLCLAIITIYANSNKIDIDNNAICRMPLEKMWAMLSRIEDLEYNEAVTDLDVVAQEGEQATLLKGILTDSFVNFDKSDINHALWNASIDLTEKCITTSFEDKSYLLSIANTRGTAGFNGATFGYMITNNCSDVVVLNQNYATERMVINPYKVYLKNAILSISPASSNLRGKVTYENGPNTTITKNVVAPYYYRGSYKSELDRQNLYNQGYSNLTTNVHNTGNNWHYNNSSYTTVTGTKTSTTYKSRLITYIPTERVNVSVQNLLPYMDNLTLTFAGIRVNFDPESNTYKGTQSGTCKADAQGNIRGSFIIPSNISTGTKEVKITDGGTLEATANFTCASVVIDTVNTIQRKTVIYKPYDPLAQSFGFDTDRFISKIGLFFASADPNNNVTVEVRDMVNGYPGTTRLGVTVLKPSDIRTSGNASVETIATFENPIYCEANKQYCVIITTDSNSNSLFIANLGDRDISTNKYVTAQADSRGVFFTSSNALTWTAEQSKDLKYKIYAKNFNTSGVVTFDPIKINANRICLNTDSLLPAHCTCEWEYTINGDNVWKAITPFVDVYLDKIATKIQIRARLTGTSYSSPVLSKEIIRLDTYLNNVSASYITKNVVMSQPFTTVRQVIDFNLPAGSSAIVQFSVDGGSSNESSWINAVQKGTPTERPLGYTQYVYETNLSTAATNFRARIKLISSKPAIIPKAKNLMNIIR